MVLHSLVPRIDSAFFSPLRLCYSRLCPNRSYCPVCFDDGLFDIIRISRKENFVTFEQISSGWGGLMNLPIAFFLLSL